MIQILNRLSVGKLQKQLLRGAVSIVLAVGIFYLVRADLLLFAVLLAVVSKWQVLLGGPRLWLHNIWDNGTDIIVLWSFLALLVAYGQDLSMQWGVVGLYLLWQLLIKPLEDTSGRGMQALYAIAIGIGTVFLYKGTLGIAPMILLGWLIGMVSASHFLGGGDDDIRRLGGVIWALLVSQFVWIFAHWTVLYPFFDGRVLIPQAAIVITAIAYVFGNIYHDHSQRRLGKKRLYGYLGFIGFIVIGLAIGSEWVDQL